MSTDTKPRFEDRLLEALLERHPARTGAPVARPQARPRRQRRGWQLGLAGATGLAVAAAGLAAAGVFTPRAASDLPDAQTVVVNARSHTVTMRPCISVGVSPVYVQTIVMTGILMFGKISLGVSIADPMPSNAISSDRTTKV